MTLAGHEGGVTCCAFRDDGTLATASADGSSRLWDLQPQWRLERRIGAMDRPDILTHRVMTLDFNSDATQLLAGGGFPSRNGELQVFDVADGGRRLFLPQAHDDVVYAARFSPDDQQIASGGADKYVRTFDSATGALIRRFEGHTNYVLSVDWKSDAQELVSASADNTLKVWNAVTGDRTRTIDRFEKHVTAVRFLGDTDDVASACGDGEVRIHRTSNGGVIRTIRGPTSWLHCLDPTPDSSVIAAGAADGALYLFNGANGQRLHELR
jgi:WD40 repeat protein